MGLTTSSDVEGGADGADAYGPAPISVVHVPGRSRFEAHASGRHAATLAYRISGPAAVLTDTYTLDRGDHGALAPLIDSALDGLERCGYYVVALCPHVRAFLREHPDRRTRVDLRFLDPTPPITHARPSS